MYYLKNKSSEGIFTKKRKFQMHSIYLQTRFINKALCCELWGCKDESHIDLVSKDARFWNLRGERSSLAYPKAKSRPNLHLLNFASSFFTRLLEGQLLLLFPPTYLFWHLIFTLCTQLELFFSCNPRLQPLSSFFFVKGDTADRFCFFVTLLP